MRRIKEVLRAFYRRLFSAPRLPQTLVLLILLAIFTDSCFVLIGQPIHYWLDYDYAVYYYPQWIRQLLAIHPLLFSGVVIMYLAVIGLILRKLSSSPALVLWMILCYVHLQGIAFGSQLGLDRFSDLDWDVIVVVAEIVFGVVVCILGLALARALPSTSGSVQRSRIPRGVMIAAILLILFLGVGMVNAMQLPDTGWLPIKTEHRPPPRVMGEIAYDLRRKRAVLFGGTWNELGDLTETFYGDTWEWDGSDWLERFPAESPPARTRYGMAYDAGRGVVVLFGGIGQDGTLGDTWEWDGESWVQRHPLTSPPARCCHTMFYDTQRGRVVLYGGFHGDEINFYAQLWEWDGENWYSFTTMGDQPPGSSGADAVYDEMLNRTVFVSSSTTWVWKDYVWHRLSGTGPIARNHYGIVYDPFDEQIVLFGGRHQGQQSNDTWVLRGETWQELDLPLSPDGRYGHVMFFDHNRQRMIVFGGYDAARGFLDDTWELVLPGD